MEYGAVGPAVNTAARLCAKARDGEVLIDARTAALTGAAGLASRGAIELKGLPSSEHFAAEAAA